YCRRLAQARIEILEAEEARRATGGSVEDLIADLPNILGAESRSTVATTRGAPSADAPTMELHWPDGREQLVVDTTLAHLPTISADELADTITALRAFEGELSDLRGQLHLVIDAIDRVLADRGDPPDLVAAVVRDPSLSERQKQVLLEIYRSFQQDDREDTTADAAG